MQPIQTTAEMERQRPAHRRTVLRLHAAIQTHRPGLETTRRGTRWARFSGHGRLYITVVAVAEARRFPRTASPTVPTRPAKEHRHA